jgi:uncharacterized protein YjbI with pentapeptide repeats
MKRKIDQNDMDRYVQQLSNGEKSINKFFKIGFFQTLDLSKVNLKGVNLSGADLSEVNLQGLNLQGANLSNTNLCNSNLSGVNLYQANLSGSIIDNIDMSNANLREADLKSVQFSSNYIYSLGEDANFSQADLSGAKLNGADLQNVNFEGANFTGADLSWANLNNAFLRSADVTGAIFIGTSYQSIRVKSILSLSKGTIYGKDSIYKIEDMLDVIEKGRIHHTPNYFNILSDIKDNDDYKNLADRIKKAIEKLEGKSFVVLPEAEANTSSNHVEMLEISRNHRGKVTSTATALSRCFSVPKEKKVYEHQMEISSNIYFQ